MARLEDSGLCSGGLYSALARRLALLLRPSQFPLESLKCGSGLVGPNCWLTVVAVADPHQDGNVSESFLDVSNVFIELPFLLSCDRVSFHGSGHCFRLASQDSIFAARSVGRAETVDLVRVQLWRA